MLDIKFIRENSEKVKKAAEDKGYKVEIDQLLVKDEERRKLLAEVDALRSQKNKLGKEDIEKGRELKSKIDQLEPRLKELEEEFKALMLIIPNPAAKDVKIGKDESENEVLRTWGEPTKFDFAPKDHLEIGKSLDLIDVERSAKVSGSRFAYLKNEAALLEFALVNFALETLIKEGFIPIIPPVMIGESVMEGMGYLSHGGGEETYHLEKDNLYLVGTSEQSVGPMHMGEILNAKDLPQRYVSFSTCFRREAGSYGKDTKGVFRVHQFDKIEMFVFSKPEDSDKEHEHLLSLEEKLMQALKIPYQVIKMCTGDLGVPAARKYDIEAWIPSQNKYRETHSTSTCTDFQARRLNVKYHREDNEVEFVHTLNGTAFAIGRTLIAILENCQQNDGTVLIPEVLQKYTGFSEIKPK